MYRDSFELSSPGGAESGLEDESLEIFPKFCEIILCNQISWTKVKLSRQSTYLVPSVLLHQPSYDWIKNRFNGTVAPSIDHLRFKTRLDGSTFLRIKQSTPSSSSSSSSSSSTSSRVQTAYRALTEDEVRQIKTLRSHFSDDNTLSLKPKEIYAHCDGTSPAVLLPKSRLKKGPENVRGEREGVIDGTEGGGEVEVKEKKKKKKKKKK